jgi:hypothetical protein
VAIELALVRVGRALRPDERTLLSALVTLRALTHEPLATRDDDALVDLADAVDPDDDAVFSEISTAGSALRAAAVEADALCEAAFGSAPALDRLHPQVALELTPVGIQLVTGLVWQALASGKQRLLLAGLECSPQLASSLLGCVPEGVDAVGLLTDPSERWLRRNLLARGVEAVRSGSDPVMRLLMADGLPPAEFLDRIDDLQLELRPTDVGLVIGPASTLIDHLPTRALDTQRDALLRQGALRHVVRLPAGFDARAPRQHLALWILAPAGQATLPADRWLLASDLSSRAMDTVAIEQLVGDVVAGLGSTRHAAAHAFAAAQVVSVPSLMATRGPLAGPGTRPHRLSEAASPSGRAEQVLRVRAALAALSTSRPDRFAGLHVGAPSRPTGQRRTPGELVTADALVREGRLRVIAGTRITPDLPEGPVKVISAADVLTHAGGAATGARAIDPLDLTRHHPRAQRVEAGDVAFVTSPRPAAVVCREPGPVVAYPARILRFSDDEVVPEVAAAVINALPATDRRWRGWAIPRAEHSAYDGLRDLLRAVEDERADLATRHTQLDELTHLLTGGAARGTLTLTTEGDD